MKEQATRNREQGTERLEALLKKAMPPVGDGAEPEHDLWPAMQQRLKAGDDVAVRLRAVPWFDWALAAGVAVCAAAFPTMIPVLLYYL